MEHQSLRAYLSILYSTPRMKIYINGKKVQTKMFEKTLFQPIKYTYSSTRFKNRAIASIKETEDQLKITESELQKANSEKM